MRIKKIAERRTIWGGGSRRRMFIRVPMAKEHTQQHWIKRGVAMLSQLDD